MYTLIRLLDPEVLISASKNMCLLAFSTSAQSYTLFKNPDVSFLLFWRSNEKMVRARSARKCFFVGKVRWNIGPRIEILALSMAIHAHNSARQLTTGKYYYFWALVLLWSCRREIQSARVWVKPTTDVSVCMLLRFFRTLTSRFW